MSRAYQLVVIGFTVLAVSAACRGRDGSLARRSEDFEVVQEGSASGVTSTITAPGEAPAPLLQPAMTDTSLDTTTTFTMIDPATGTSGTGGPGTLADTLPDPSDHRRPRSVSRPSSEPRRVEPPIIDAPRPAPPPQEEPREEPAPQPPAEPAPEPEEPAEPQPTPPTTTATTPPPGQ